MIAIIIGLAIACIGIAQYCNPKSGLTKCGIASHNVRNLAIIIFGVAAGSIMAIIELRISV